MVGLVQQIALVKCSLWLDNFVNIQPTYFSVYLWLSAVVLFICKCHFVSFFAVARKTKTKKHLIICVYY
jgi:hypothetical protein